MTKQEFFIKKKAKKSKPWEPLAVRSLSGSNLMGYGIEYGSTPPLLTQTLSGGTRAVHGSFSTGPLPGLSLAGDLNRRYPHRAEDYELKDVCGTGATAQVSPRNLADADP